MKKLWFKARPYGWGWYPCSWQGFVALGVWGFWLYVLFQIAHPEQHPIWFMAGLYGSIPLLILVCWKTGERPSWRWGGKTVPVYTVLMKVGVILGLAAATLGLILWIF